MYLVVGLSVCTLAACGEHRTDSSSGSTDSKSVDSLNPVPEESLDLFGHPLFDSNGNPTRYSDEGFRGSNDRSTRQAELSAGPLFESFSYQSTGSWAEVVATGDVNSDGKNDVVVGTSSYFDPDNDKKIHLFLQDDVGHLVKSAKYDTASATVRGIDTGDLNGDGLTDVIVAASTTNSVRVFHQNVAHSLDSGIDHSAGAGPDSVRICRLNEDLLFDAVASNWNSDFLSIFFQDPARQSLSPQTMISIAHAGYDEIDCGDLNHDGLDDILFMRGQGLLADLVVIHQLADGSFGAPVQYVTGTSWASMTHGVAIGDLTGDGRNDIAVSIGGNVPNSWLGLFIQNQEGSFGPVQMLSAYHIPEAIEVADVNGDGRSDVVLGNGGWNTVSIYTQDSCGNLNPFETYAVPYQSHFNPQGLAVSDINSDGKNDISIANYNYGLVSLLGTGARDSSAPILEATSPANRATNVAIDTAISLTFDEEIAPCSGLFFAMKIGNKSAEPLVGHVTINGNIVTADGFGQFPYNKTIEIQVTGAMDMAGNVMEPSKFSFQTVRRK